MSTDLFRYRRIFLGVIAFSMILPFQLMGEVNLEKIISREDSRFDCEKSIMTLGRDGKIYLATNANPGYVLRVNLDGEKRFGAEVQYALSNATANSAGVMATAHAHFVHGVNLFEKDFVARGTLKDFLVSDKVGWDAPARIEAGVSDDFYALDQHRNRVLRLNSFGKIVRVLSFAEETRPLTFRVSEAVQLFYFLLKDNILQSVGFDGKVRWTKKITPLFTTQDDGTVFYLSGNTLKRINSEGSELSDINLAIEDVAKFPITAIAISKKGLILKRRHPFELFQIYDVKSGKLLKTVLSSHENISASFQNLIWVAGEKIPFVIKSQKPMQWHVWASPFGTTDWRELEFKDGSLAVPRDFAGLYQIRIGPILNPEAMSEYLLREIVEVRIAQSRGTLSVWTPFNRVHWARGEPIPLSVELRNGKEPSDLTVKLSLVSADSSIKWAQQIQFDSNKKSVSTSIPAEISEKLAPGPYLVSLESQNLTCINQPVKIGLPANSVSPFLITEYGDYLNFNSLASAWEFEDVAEAMLDRSQRLHINQYVNRIFAGRYPLTFSDDHDGKVVLENLQKRLTSSPEGVSPHKAEFGFAHAHALGAFGANRIREMLLLVKMDEALPIGTSTYYSRGLKFDEYATIIKKYSDALKSFPAFHGWDCVANWWVTNSDLRFQTTEEKKAYEAALKEADEKGIWNAILEKVGDYVIGWQTDAQAEFKKMFSQVDAKLSTASSGPYRRPEVYPPSSFSNIDEVDLHYQAEQITTPNWTAHAVDYYKRPGKPAWMHPEFAWNDSGTGEQILPMSFLALMRGVNGIGISGAIKGESQRVSMADSRSGYLGTASVFRALNTLAASYGPWLNNLTKADQIAIPVSSRQVKVAQLLEVGIGGSYFSRLYEAYQTCLYAHIPATFIFTEDKPDLRRFKALLVVGQRYEPEPALTKLFSQAEKMGITIFADGTNRDSFVQKFRPLNLSFNNIEKLNGFNNDLAYWTFPQIFINNAPKLAQNLASVVEPVAIVNQPDVVISERDSTEGSFVWVVNNSRSPFPPEILWRVLPGISSGNPLIAHVKLNVRADEVVYDLFAQKEITSEFDADLRFLPARLYAIFPKNIDFLKLDAPKVQSPMQNLFGPHVKDVAISQDGTMALLNTFDWGQNLYGIDLATGLVKWTNKIGDYFAFAPTAWHGGLFAQGYDFKSANGYHLYSIDLKGSIKKKFAIPGLPARLASWATGSDLSDSINNFAAAPDGSWIAAGGNLATATWNQTGKLLWKEDWSLLSRKVQKLLPLNNQTLLSAEGGTLTAKSALNNKVKWALPLTSSASIQSMAVSADMRTVLVGTSTQYGKVFIVRDGKLRATIPYAANSMVLASNGVWIATTNGKQLFLYSDKAEPLWIFAADSVLGKLSASGNGKLLAVSDELGTLYILDVASGKVLLKRDLGALAVTTWLANGDLLFATWMGVVGRMTANGSEKWLTRLAEVAVKPPRRESKIPTVQLACCSNAESRLTKKNQLALKEIHVSALSGIKELLLQNDSARLFDDGIPTPFENPWIKWEDIDMIDSGWRGSFSFVIDIVNTLLRIDEISFVEDADHPESWLRDAKLEYWNPKEERWIFAQYLVSNSAIHSHKLIKPLLASKFRLTRPDSIGWPVGNLRFEKIAFYGKRVR